MDCIDRMDYDALFGKDCIGERIEVALKGRIEPCLVAALAELACVTCLTFIGTPRIVNAYQGRRQNSDL